MDLHNFVIFHKICGLCVALGCSPNGTNTVIQPEHAITIALHIYV